MLSVHEQHGRAKLTATVLAVLVVAGIVIITDHLKAKGSTAASTFSQSSANQPAASSSTNSQSSTSAATSSSTYKDGTYAASDNYFVPHGNESIQVNLTLQNGVITSASVQNSESDPTSAAFQEDFAATFKSMVVGRKISGLQIGVVAGASDTSQAFNQAVSQIATKARA